MRKGIIASAIGTIALFGIYQGINSDSPLYQEVYSNVAPESLDKRTRMDLAMKQEFERTKDPSLGYVPKQRLKDAYDYALKKKGRQSKYANKTAITGVSWKDLMRTQVMMYLLSQEIPR